jgi:hypothetical protein
MSDNQSRRGDPDEEQSSPHPETPPRAITPSGHQVITPSPPRPWQVGERVRLRKAHPCGSTDRQIVRTGADIRITCHGCGRRVELPRDEFNRRVKSALDGPPGR